jgi:hypothetical protein
MLEDLTGEMYGSAIAQLGGSSVWKNKLSLRVIFLRFKRN